MNKKNFIFTLIIFIIFNIFSRIIHIFIPFHKPTDIIWHNILAVVWFILLGILHMMILKSKSRLIFFIPLYWLVEISRLFFLTWIQDYYRIKPLCFLYDLGIPLWGGDYLLSLYNYYTHIYFLNVPVPALVCLHHIVRFVISVACIAFSSWYVFHLNIQPLHALSSLREKFKTVNKNYVILGTIAFIIILGAFYLIFLSYNPTGRRL